MTRFSSRCITLDWAHVLSRWPPFQVKIAGLVQNHIQLQTRECEEAVDRWRGKYIGGQRELHACQKECQGMKQELREKEQQLQTASKEQGRLLQQQACAISSVFPRYCQVLCVTLVYPTVNHKFYQQPIVRESGALLWGQSNQKLVESVMTSAVAKSVFWVCSRGMCLQLVTTLIDLFNPLYSTTYSNNLFAPC